MNTYAARAKRLVRGNPKLIAAALITAAILALTVHLCTYRKVETVIIQKRYWSYSLYVRYDTTSTTTECDTDQVCSGYGEDRTCRSETTCRPVTTTTTHTRCADRTAGDTLPPQRPPLPCNMQYGDYLDESIGYSITYRVTESDRIKSANFGGEIWHDLEPDTMVKLTLTAWNWITKAERAR